MQPVLFTIPTPWGSGLPVYSYGLMLGLALVLGYQLVVRLATGARAASASASRMTEAVVGNAYLVSALAGLLGARVVYVLWNPTLIEESGARWYDVTAGGVNLYGGLLGAFVGAALFMRLSRAPLLDLADAAAPVLGLGTCFTRIGSYLYGSDFGTRLADDAPGWLRALGSFPAGSPVHHHHNDRYGLAADAPTAFPVHPTQLYEAVFGALLFGLALRAHRRRAFPGQAILLVLGLFGGFQFLIEYLRDDPERGEALGFSGVQLMSLGLVPLCAVLYSTLQARARRSR